MTTTLVTGGAGFIGSHLVEALVARGDDVRVLDDFSSGRASNLAAVRDRVTVVTGDLGDDARLAAAVDGVDYIHHLAALVSVPLSVERPLEAQRINVEATVRLYEAARQAGVRRVVVSTSSACYGDHPSVPSREDDLLAPISPYAVSKVACELYGRAYSETLGLDVVALRYFNVFGPRQDPNGPYAAVIPRFIEMLRRGEAPTLHGDGTQSRDFVYVADVVRANLLAREAAAAPGRVYNIGSGEAIDLLTLVRTLNRILGLDLAPSFAPKRAGDVMESRADISRAREELGYEPEHDLEGALRETAAWYGGRQTCR